MSTTNSVYLTPRVSVLSRTQNRVKTFTGGRVAAHMHSHAPRQRSSFILGLVVTLLRAALEGNLIGPNSIKNNEIKVTSRLVRTVREASNELQQKKEGHP